MLISIAIVFARPVLLLQPVQTNPFAQLFFKSMGLSDHVVQSGIQFLKFAMICEPIFLKCDNLKDCSLHATDMEYGTNLWNQLIDTMDDESFKLMRDHLIANLKWGTHVKLRKRTLQENDIESNLPGNRRVPTVSNYRAIPISIYLLNLMIVTMIFLLIKNHSFYSTIHATTPICDVKASNYNECHKLIENVDHQPIETYMQDTPANIIWNPSNEDVLGSFLLLVKQQMDFFNQ
eukprot:NODE_440_length_7390_cov_0.787546.p6 type:complete len:234 gc:universal NODE_440_length_7390_cov_0.787546:1427-2128(+)